ncbi:MAG TPA: hypothetical protein VKU86_12550 [Acidimicrobiales bacterium]|nr:hypothetical protein [Acidimicrobiales bacterium]
MRATGAVPVLLVHGAWHGAWCWEPVLELLADRGGRPELVTNEVVSIARRLSST